MDSLSSKCAEAANSTDCLLRTLIQFLEDAKEDDDGKFEWDPITFGFTVSIAIAAAGFALITIVQAVLAAGPGRRKSSSEAIGKWSKYTVWKWQWWNLGYLHIAKTPILTIENVVGYLASKDHEDGPKSMDSSSGTTITAMGQGSRKHGASAASWLIFLDMTGLSDLKLEAEALKTTLADYLPGDLLAVPALVEVRLIFLMMAMSNKTLRVLEAGTRYLNLVGTESQFEIRQHPTLGSVGAFSSHRPIRTAIKIPSEESLGLALKHAKGIISFSETPFRTFVSWREVDVFMEELTKPYLFEINVTNRWSVANLAWLHSFNCEVPGCDGYLRESISFQLHWDFPVLYGFMFANIPKVPPETFPWSMVPIMGMFEALSVTADIAAEGKLKPDSEISSRRHILGIILDSPHSIDPCPFILANAYQRAYCPCQDVVEACTQLLLGFPMFSDWVTAFPTDRIPEFRIRILKLLKMLDYWLINRTSDENLVTCQATWLLLDTMSFQGITTYLTMTTREAKSVSTKEVIAFFREKKKASRSDGPDFDNFTFTHDEGSRILNGLTNHFWDVTKTLERLGDIMHAYEKGKETWHHVQGSNNGPDGLAPSEVDLLTKAFKESESERTGGEPSGSPSGQSATSGNPSQPSDQLIRRVLAWRITLMAVLYFTAHDTAPMLSSGIWEQVIPML